MAKINGNLSHCEMSLRILQRTDGEKIKLSSNIGLALPSSYVALGNSSFLDIASLTIRVNLKKRKFPEFSDLGGCITWQVFSMQILNH